jgi:hypothetical protein
MNIFILIGAIIVGLIIGLFMSALMSAAKRGDEKLGGDDLA